VPLIPIPDAHAARFVEFAELLTRCRDALWFALADLVPGSLADRDRAALHARIPPYPADAPLAITKTACFYLIGACEQLGGLAALYTCREVALAPAALVRSTLEHCSRVRWLLSGSDVDVRLARAYLERLFSAEEAKKNAGYLLGTEDERYRREVERFVAVKDEVRAIFPEPLRDPGGGSWLLRGERRPRLGDAVLEMYSSELVGQGVYGLLSNFSHPTVYTLSRIWGAVTENGEARVRVQHDLETHEVNIRYAVLAFYVAFVDAVRYHGWSAEPHDALVSHIDRLLPGAVSR
jgi:hypothetical protein